MRVRYLLVGAAASMAFATAAGGATSASAPPPYELDVMPYTTAPGAVADTEIDLYVPDSQPTASFTVYAPTGYAANLTAAPGTKIGGANVYFNGASGNVQAPGSVLADDPARHTADACAPGTHAAVWVLSLLAGGQPLQIPVYVDPVSGPTAAKAAYQLAACTSPATAAGLTLQSVAIDLPSVFTNPATRGGYVWRSLVTPYGAGNVADATRTVEVQSFVGFPQRLTLTTKYNRKRHTITLSGTLVRTGTLLPAAGINIRAEAASTPSVAALKPWAVTKTDAHGRYTITKPLTGTRYVIVYVNFYYTDPCDPTIGTAPCALETLAPPPSVFVKVTPK